MSVMVLSVFTKFDDDLMKSLIECIFVAISHSFYSSHNVLFLYDYIINVYTHAVRLKVSVWVGWLRVSEWWVGFGDEKIYLCLYDINLYGIVT